MTEELKCLRCGKCCYFPDKNNELRKCRNLVKLPSGKTLCRIYNKRTGFKIDDEKVCGDRLDILYDFEGCPYNADKPILW
jgi:hypothetical protein